MLLQLVKSLAARGWHRSAMILLDGALLLKPRDLGLLRERLLQWVENFKLHLENW